MREPIWLLTIRLGHGVAVVADLLANMWGAAGRMARGFRDGFRDRFHYKLKQPKALSRTASVDLIMVRCNWITVLRLWISSRWQGSLTFGRKWRSVRYLKAPPGCVLTSTRVGSAAPLLICHE